jgi:hypothetical protein
MRARNAGGELAEAAFQRQVEQLAAFYGWRTYHTHDSRRSAAGFPDLVLIRGPELLFVELKTDRGRLSAAQAAWLEALGYVADAVERAASTALGESVLDAGRYLNGEERPDVNDLAVEAHLWRPAMFDDVIHPRLALGRARQPVDWAR